MQFFISVGFIDSVWEFEKSNPMEDLNYRSKTLLS